MKTSLVFSYIPETSCPSCDTPRVGVDQDDDYTIVPGRIIERPECHADDEIVPWEQYPPFPMCSDDYYTARYASIGEARADAAALAAEPCPYCGGERFMARAERDTLYYFRVCCRNAYPSLHTGRREIDPEPGCAHCREHHFI